jgi:hypothetical protein
MQNGIPDIVLILKDILCDADFESVKKIGKKFTSIRLSLFHLNLFSHNLSEIFFKYSK